MTRASGMVAATVGLAATACDAPMFRYAWDDRAVVCSLPLDDLGKTPHWDVFEEQAHLAVEHDEVALVHAHIPNVTLSTAALARTLDTAEANDLDFVTYRELVAGAPARPGLALAFDDHAIEEWFAIRETLRARDARVTFFVTRMYSTTPEQLEMLRLLEADGHDIQSHGFAHRDAVAYAAEHGVDAYVADEVVPSFTMLQQLGFAPRVYAYPFGASTDALDRAVLQHVDRVRVGPGTCPY